jgi:hypothetical protein
MAVAKVKIRPHRKIVCPVLDTPRPRRMAVLGGTQGNHPSAAAAGPEMVDRYTATRGERTSERDVPGRGKDQKPPSITRIAAPIAHNTKNSQCRSSA